MAAYNSYGNNPYLMGPYQQQSYTPVQQPVQQQQPTSNILWVQGVEGAKAHLVAPGHAVALWDSEAQTIYIKSADNSGVPQPLRILDYTERAPMQEIDAATSNNYATKDDIQSISAQLQALSETISQLQHRNNNFKKGGNQNGQPSV